MYNHQISKLLALSAIITLLFSSQVLVVDSPKPINTQFSLTPTKQPLNVKSAVAGENPNVTVSVTSDKVTYKPLENVTVTANITNQESYEMENVTVKTVITDAFGEEELHTENETLNNITASGNVSVQAVWTAPNITMAGFVAKVSVFDNQSVLLASGYWVFDVVEDWTKVPRYGFFTSRSFAPDVTNLSKKVEALKLFHINSLQFYDWFELHGNYTPTKSQYSMLGFPISRDRVIETIGLAQNAGMKCMAYTTIYSAAQQVYNQHTEWGLTDGPGGPPLTFVGWLYYMNPDTPCGWHDYLIGEFLNSTAMFNWDGIHLDQYGEGWTSDAYWNGSRVDMVDAFQHFINDAVGNITQAYPEGKLIFNYVTYWPECYEMMEKNTTVSSLYVEVWQWIYPKYADVRYLIRQGKEYNSSKAVIIAAYTPPSLPAILLLDAEIFANQGFHIELGDGYGLLTEPGGYYTNRSIMTEDMATALRSYYETITRYEQYIYDAAVQELPISTVKVTGYPYGISPSANSIQVIPYTRVVNGSEEARIIHLINFRGVTNMNWKESKSAPTELSGVPVEVQIPSEKMEEPKGVYLVNPDSSNTDPVALPFTFNASTNTIKFSVPSLKYWNIIMIRYVEPSHDITVTDTNVFANPSKYPSIAVPVNQLYPTWGVPVKVNVTVTNEGDYAESFTVTVFLQNSTGNYTKGTKAVNNLAPGASTKLTFTFAVPPLKGYAGPGSGPQKKAWPYPTYTVWANASVVSGETNTTNNAKADGTIKVVWPGDISSVGNAGPDGKINTYDLFYFARSWNRNANGPTYYPPTLGGYDYRADFDMDGAVGTSDLYHLGRNWGKGPLDG